MKILYLPLDERPCNYKYPQLMMNGQTKVELIVPPKELLGNKKEAADVEKLWEYVFDMVNNIDAMVMSVELMFYGGLLPSRLHKLDEEHSRKILNYIQSLKVRNPKIKIYGFNLIMRTPKYNSSDEEPEYYENYGANLFKKAYLEDKKSRESLTKEEEIELGEIEIPSEYIKDYETRRTYNVEVNKEMIKLVESQAIDFLSIPQDDSAPFGYTAIDQQKVYQLIKDKRLQKCVQVYPGADEVGTALVARAVNELLDKKIKIYPFYASLEGPFITPLYEDRSMYESLQVHIRVAGCKLVDNDKEADLVLAINAPGKSMIEATEQKQNDVTYASLRNIGYFVERIEEYINDGKKVIVADCAYANGGDIEFIQLLDEYKVLDQLISYHGWNTHCNTLGTTIAQGVVAIGLELNLAEIKKNILYHILEDGFYQSIVRKEVTDSMLDYFDLTYFDLKDQGEVIASVIVEKLKMKFHQYIQCTFLDLDMMELEVTMPWNRMFEIDIELEI